MPSTASVRSERSAEIAQQVWRTDQTNPFNWPRAKKWRVTLAAAAVTFLVGLNSTAVTTPGHAIAETFHVDETHFPHSFWPVTVWNTGAAFGSIVGMPLLENFGSRNGYLLSYLVFTIMVIPQAVAPNFATLLVGRAIAGALGGVLQNAMETFIADIWLTDEERNIPVTLYTLVLTAGVTLGPAFGAIVEVLSWRWVFYIQLILYCTFFPVLILVIDETRGLVVLSRRAREDPNLEKASRQENRPSIPHLLFEAITRPTCLLCIEPVVFCFTLWSSFSFGLVFISTQSVAQVYSTNYAFTDAASGLVQITLFVGEICGFLACLPQTRYYQKSAARNTVEAGVPVPEARLHFSIPASLLGLTGGLFWYAWGSFRYVHWMVPTVGLAFVGFGIMVIVTTVGFYITDAYGKYAGSAIAAVAFGESMFAAWLPLAASSMYTALGFQWASSLLGFVALILTLAPIGLALRYAKLEEDKYSTTRF
ncbi:hypothetical protein G7Y79_00050g085580 [Physcia stellaris]|nr:hypothetical protein G7Y79_00050g085580 [Physcia stellaris]